MKKQDKFTNEQLAESTVFPVTLTAAQKKEALAQLTVARKKTQTALAGADRLALPLMRLKFQLEDYINSKQYDSTQSFGYFLKKYISILEIKRKSFAADISIDETMLSQVINGHRTPPGYLWIRLELHSNNIIPAAYWYKLVEKQREYDIMTNKELRTREKKFVHKFEMSF